MFERGRRYVRRELHEELGGQRYGGIVTPKRRQMVLLVTGEAGEKAGYSDSLESDGVWRYFGEGQRGDMEFVRGNKAVRDHAIDGKELHLFRSDSRGGLVYVGQFNCGEYEIQPGVPDVDGNFRNAIVFHLVPFEEFEANGSFDPGLGSGRTRWDLPMNELRAMASSSATRQTASQGARRNVYARSQALRIYVLRRAGGRCEGCGAVAPFKSKDDRPYLECHHTTRLADGGPDHPSHVIALCPNCHRRVHEGKDGTEFNQQLIEKLSEFEPNEVAGKLPVVIEA